MFILELIAIYCSIGAFSALALLLRQRWMYTRLAPWKDLTAAFLGFLLFWPFILRVLWAEGIHQQGGLSRKTNQPASIKTNEALPAEARERGARTA